MDTNPLTEPVSRLQRLLILPVWRAIKRLFEPQVRIVTGGIAFYALFSIFPLIYLTLTLMGALLPDELAARLAQPVGDIIAQGAEPLTGEEIEEIRGLTPTGITFRALIAFILVLFTASTGAKAAITGIRMIAGTRRKGGLFRFQGVSLLLTGGLILTVWLLGAAQLIVSTAQDESQLAARFASEVGALAGALKITKLIASFVIFYVIIGLSLRGHISSGRAMLAGAATAALAWMALTFGFQLYLQYSVLDTLYGALASVILGFIWLSGSVSCLLLGAALAVEWSYAWKDEIADDAE